MAEDDQLDNMEAGSPEEQIVGWINQLDFANTSKKLTLLRQIQEVLIHQCPHSLPMYLDDILCFIADRSQEVKKMLVGFMEEISKISIELLPRMVGNLQMLLMDVSIPVQKRVIQAANTVYKNAFIWMCKAADYDSSMEKAWESLNNIKLNILNMVDCDNEGVRTNSIKFLEGIIILQTYREESKANDYSLDDIPPTIKFIQKQKLEEESMHIFNLLLKFHNSQHISGVNLMACSSALCEIAKARPKFLINVIQAFSALQSNLPPTLSQSQINSVKKHLKMQILNLVRHHSTNDLVSELLQMLSDLGMTPQEIAKIAPKGDRKTKRLFDMRNGENATKKARIDSPLTNTQDGDISNEVTEISILNGLQNIDYVVNLVMASMKNLPDEVPAHFPILYEPISSAGVLVNHASLAKLMLRMIKNESNDAEQPNEDEERIKLKNALAKLDATKLDVEESARDKELLHNFEKDKDKPLCPPTPTIPKLKQRVKSLKLHMISKPLSQNIREKLIDGAVERVLKSEMAAINGGGHAHRTKMLSLFAVSFTDQVRESILSFILDDVINRFDLALAWMYEEYTYIQGFNQKILGNTNASKIDEKSFQNFNNLLCSLVVTIAELTDPSQELSRDNLFRRVYLEAPFITSDAMAYLKKLCSEEDKYTMGLNLLRDLMVYQPTKASKYITVLLSVTVHKNPVIREMAVDKAVHLYKRKTESLRRAIDKHANLYLGFIALSDPPKDLFDVDPDTPDFVGTWDDELFKTCLQLYLAILPYNDELLSELCRIYVGTSADGKRCVLRLLETPIRHLGPNNSALLSMIEECPKGAETLVTRIIHILTEKGMPSPELVTRVRDLYAKKVSDVRFLIPVINGLTKTEILAALPKLIKLNPIVIREAFNKILMSHVMDNENYPQPVSAAELLIALHLIDNTKVELKYVIKATSLCFADKQAYTAEVLGDVLQELVEQPQLPVLLMRSVLQALSSHPNRLSGLVMNILLRLITRQVWEQKVVWEGFIKCCQRLSPQSVNVLVMLPLDPLRQVLTSCNDLFNTLSQSLQSLTNVPSYVYSLMADLSVNETTLMTLDEKPDNTMDSIGNSEPLPPGME